MTKNNQTKVDTKGAAEKSGNWLKSFFSNQMRLDGWSNIISGLNRKEKDARTHQDIKWNKMTEVDIEHFYAGDAMATKIVDAPVAESLEKGYEWEGISTSEAERLNERLKELCFDDKIVEAGTKGRLYGGSAILKAYDDDLILQNAVDPLAPPVIKALVVFHRFEIYATWEDIDKDMLSTNFKKPCQYTFIGRDAILVNELMTKINATRLVRFDGAKLPERLYQSNGYWDDTVLSKVYDSIRNYSFAHDSVNAALKDMSTAVFKIKNLADQVASDCDDLVLKRMELVNMTKSMVRAVVLDAEGEDFDYKVRNLTGAGELVDRAENRLAAESSFPRTVLFGQSPAGGGLGATGDHDSENWYNFLEAYRKNKLAPQMLAIAKEVCFELGIDHSKLSIAFASLWQASEKEETETNAKQAETDIKYIDAGVVDPSEIRKSRFGGDKFSLKTSIDASLDKVLVEQANEGVDDIINKTKELENKNKNF